MGEFGFVLKKLVSSLVLPPAGPVLVVLIGLAVMRKRRRLGQGMIVLSALGTLALSIPLVSGALMAALQSTPVLDPSATHRAEAIVVLAGGIRRQALEYGGRDDVGVFSLERLRYAAWLARRTGLPILLSGGGYYDEEGLREAEAMAAALTEDFGLTARWLETKSLDTAENAVESARLLQADNITRVLLVTHAWHMRRAMEEFSRTGLRAIAAPTKFAGSGPVELLSYLPNGRSYSESTFALHEWLGLLWRGLKR